MNTSYVTKSGIDSTLAIILGASSWPYCAKRFSKCESFQKSSEGVRRYLKSRKGLGVPPEKVLYLFNRRISHSGILKAIAEFIDNQSKVIPNDDHTKPLNIIIYYTGHGIVTPGTSQLFLTHIDSREDDLYHSSIAISSLAKTLRDRRGLFRRYIILDCCFAGEAFKDLQADGLELFRKKLEESFPDKGTALLASCGNNEVSKHVGPPDSPFTMFSWGLLTVLREGDSQYDEYLSLKQLCDLIQARLRSEFHDEAVIPITHTPEKADGDIALMPLFPNAHKEKNGSKRTKVVKEFAGEEAEEALEIFSYYIRQVVCYNQGELPQYSLLANELHREVKKCYTARQKDIGSIREACDKLQGYLNRNLFIICDKNFDLLKQYFRDRHHIEPRICVKEHI